MGYFWIQLHDKGAFFKCRAFEFCLSHQSKLWATFIGFQNHFYFIRWKNVPCDFAAAYVFASGLSMYNKQIIWRVWKFQSPLQHTDPGCKQFLDIKLGGKSLIS